MYKNIASNKLFTLQSAKLTQFICAYNSENVFGFRKKEKTSYEVPLEEIRARSKESNFYRLVNAYREHGHKISNINPVSLNKNNSFQAELDPNRYGLQTLDKVDFKGILNINKNHGTIKEALEILENIYGNTLSAEFMHTETEEEKEWFSKRLESLSTEKIDQNTKIKIAKELLKSQTFDNFLGNKFSGLKRYGGEGAESMMAFFSELFKLSGNEKLEHIVLAMPHRGRLNLLTGMLKMPPGKLFRKLKGLPDFPDHFRASGDVISHLISSVDLTPEEINSDTPLHVTMLYNPSHLESVNPVSMGKTRAKSLTLQDGDYSDKNLKWSSKVLNLQVHGDGALIGQGVNAECLAISRAPNFEIGGTLHLVVNNQVAFTTPGDRGRSSRYCTDIGKMVGAPVIHVNGDYPEMVVKATRLAFEYQRKFRKDIFVDINCFRKWGHNELDDPTITNPALYNIINSRNTVPDMYVEQLNNEGIINKNEMKEIVDNYYEWLNQELKVAENYVPEDPCFTRQWGGYQQAPNAITMWDTGVDKNLLIFLGVQSVTYPKKFNVHSNLLKTHIQARISKISDGTKIDWATAESLAFGSLLYEGYNVRLSGQDVGRGTFSHRHAMLVDQKTNNIYIPLNHMDIGQKGFLELANSILSEEAILAYEYGFSIESPTNLTVWEAQFGDFFNGAQTIFDTFISSGEAKWLWSSALTVLLPHGYDGAGPEHSSSRVERFLQMSDSKENGVDGDDVNWSIIWPTTPAQYFHALRRQMVRTFKKPLIIIAPKTLLRYSSCVSSFEEMTPGTSFRNIIGDKRVNPKDVKKIVFSSGRHCYNLEEKRNNLGALNTAIVRLESLCPFPVLDLQEELKKYPNAKCFVWSQEEPQNMGAWSFVKPRFENLLGKRLKYIGRPTMAAPAVGVGKWHQEQSENVITEAFNIKI